MFIKRKSANLFKKSVILALGKIAKTGKKEVKVEEKVKKASSKSASKQQKPAEKDEPKIDAETL